MVKLHHFWILILILNWEPETALSKGRKGASDHLDIKLRQTCNPFTQTMALHHKIQSCRDVSCIPILIGWATPITLPSIPFYYCTKLNSNWVFTSYVVLPSFTAESSSSSATIHGCLGPWYIENEEEINESREICQHTCLTKFIIIYDNLWSMKKEKQLLVPTTSVKDGTSCC